MNKVNPNHRTSSLTDIELKNVLSQLEKASEGSKRDYLNDWTGQSYAEHCTFKNHEFKPGDYFSDHFCLVFIVLEKLDDDIFVITDLVERDDDHQWFNWSGYKVVDSNYIYTHLGFADYRNNTSKFLIGWNKYKLLNNIKEIKPILYIKPNPKNIITLEYVTDLVNKLDVINNTPLKDIALTKNNKPIIIDEDLYEEWRFIGLSNKDFITIINQIFENKNIYHITLNDFVIKEN